MDKIINVKKKMNGLMIRDAISENRKRVEGEKENRFG